MMPKNPYSTENLRKREAALTAALSTETGIAKIGESIHKIMIGTWRPGGGKITCYKCQSTNIEIQLGFMEHWSGMRKHCFDCDHRSYGLEAINRGYTIVEKLSGYVPQGDSYEEVFI